jgi:hypothetical protein
MAARRSVTDDEQRVSVHRLAGVIHDQVGWVQQALIEWWVMSAGELFRKSHCVFPETGLRNPPSGATGGLHPPYK